jgi:hypothetical protein
MKTRAWMAAALATLAGCSSATHGNAVSAAGAAGGTPLVGSWHLVSLELPGPDGVLKHITDAKGSLIYAASGQVSVQVMYASADVTPSSGPVQYAQGGYEGSFGRYVVNEATHTVTHRYGGANVRSLLGKDLPRRYEIVNGRLVLSSTRLDEHWSVTWDRD